MSALPLVAIVGRPNVGKSTLFNRLIRRRKAIVQRESGTTRDRNYETIQVDNQSIRIVDTGGFQFAKSNTMEFMVDQEVEKAIAEADEILFVVDGASGITHTDERFADILRKINRPVRVVVNKLDDKRGPLQLGEFYHLGFDTVLGISAAHGHGIDELLTDMCKSLPEQHELIEEDPYLFNLSIIGEPNVGKSTYLNALLEKDRVIVSEIPGTTRDLVEESFEYEGKKIRLVDTAGLRSEKKMKSATEFFSFTRTKEALKKADVIVLLFDATLGLKRDSKNILKKILEERKALILVGNKWDLSSQREMARYKNDLVEANGFLKHFPIFFTSGLKAKNILQPIEESFKIFEYYNQLFSTKELNDFLEMLKKKKPPQGGKLKYLVQTHRRPLRFNLFVKGKQRVPRDYWGFLENQFMSHFKVRGVGLKMNLVEEKTKEK